MSKPKLDTVSQLKMAVCDYISAIDSLQRAHDSLAVAPPSYSNDLLNLLETAVIRKKQLQGLITWMEGQP